MTSVSSRLGAQTTGTAEPPSAAPIDAPETGPWASVPLHRRSIARAYINSENEDDRERANAICKQYDLDYAEMRRVVLAEMTEESRKLGKTWTPSNRSQS